MASEPIFYQLFESQSSTYTYLIGDPESREAALIDSVLETVDRDLNLVNELGLRLVYVLDTHVHADHITGAGEIRSRTGAKTCISRTANVTCADVNLADGDELSLGARKIKVIATPGHTDSCLSFHFEDKIFTGDALLIRGSGRTDFQQGSSERLYQSVTEKLFRLPKETKVYPAHDYRGQTVSTIEMEVRHNPRLGGSRSLEEFVKTMNELKLSDPAKIHEAVPANLNCGKPQSDRALRPQMIDGIPEIGAESLVAIRERVRKIDVRRPDEFNGDLGHIEGAQLVTLGPDLVNELEASDRHQEIVFICRSGARSAQATAYALQMGFQSVANLKGGMIRWNELGLPVERKK